MYTFCLSNEASPGIERDRFASFHWNVNSLVITYYQLVAAISLFEKVENTFFFKEPADKVEVCFAVLDTESPPAVFVGKRNSVLVAHDVGVLKYFGYDVLYRHFL